MSAVEPAGAPGLFVRIRTACAAVAADARHVTIHPGRLEAFASELARDRPELPNLDPTHQAFADPRHTLAFVLTMNAVNFGSGWFPHLRKPPGLSGYRTLAAALRRRFESHGPFPAEALAELDLDEVARIFEQPRTPAVDELMTHYTQALRDLGGFLLDGYAGRFEGPVEASRARAEQLVQRLAQMPLYRDVARWREIEVPLFKRAQITAADLALVFAGEGPGRFEDLDQLTLFADNLVPHVLRMEGVLRYAPGLLDRIEAGQPIPLGCPEEVEIRAVALHAVEQLVAGCRARGWAIRAHDLDHRLWTRGQAPEMKAAPRHRTRCTFY